MYILTDAGIKNRVLAAKLLHGARKHLKASEAMKLVDDLADGKTLSFGYLEPETFIALCDLGINVERERNTEVDASVSWFEARCATYKAYIDSMDLALETQDGALALQVLAKCKEMLGTGELGVPGGGFAA